MSTVDKVKKPAKNENWRFRADNDMDEDDSRPRPKPTRPLVLLIDRRSSSPSLK